MEINDRQFVDRRVDDRTTARNRKAIESQARAELRNSAYAPVRRVSCQYDDGVLTLNGQVPSYYLKQIAQSVIFHRLEGIVVIDNRVEVVSE